MPTILFTLTSPDNVKPPQKCCIHRQATGTQNLSSLQYRQPLFNYACSQANSSIAQRNLLPQSSTCHQPPGPAVKLSAPDHPLSQISDQPGEKGNTSWLGERRWENHWCWHEPWSTPMCLPNPISNWSFDLNSLRVFKLNTTSSMSRILHSTYSSQKRPALSDRCVPVGPHGFSLRYFTLSYKWSPMLIFCRDAC